MWTLIVTLFCGGVGVAFIRVTFTALQKDKFGLAGTSMFLAAFFVFCGLPWFQGLAKTWLQSEMYAKLTTLGQQVNGIQETTGKMQTELSEHQTQIDAHQKELDQQQTKIRDAQASVSAQQGYLTNQFLQFSNLQNQLASAQTTILTQQKKIDDVQYLVDNLFSKITYETFSSADTNHFITKQISNGLWYTCLKLKYAPLSGSIQASITDPSHIWSMVPKSLGGPLMTRKNIFFHGLVGDWNINNVVYNLQYVRDDRETNLSQKVEYRGNAIFVDGENINVVDPP
jgi:hypothetical protein